MSQNNPKYKRLETLLSDAKQVEPEPYREPEGLESEAPKVQIPQPDAKPAVQEAETVKAQDSQPDVQPVAQPAEILKVQEAEPDAQPFAQPAEILKAQVAEPDAQPFAQPAEILKAQVAEPEEKPAASEVKTPKALVVEPDEKPVTREVESPKAQVAAPDLEPAGREPAHPAREKAPLKQAWAKLVQPRTLEAESQANATGTQYQLALWTTGIFTILGVIFFFFSLYNVLILQQGHVDPSDTILTPVTILMMVASLSGFVLIRRGRFILGLWLTFTVAIIPPIMAVLVLGNVFAVALVYLVILALAMITWVFPASEKRKAIFATAAAILVMIVIELWNPAFRFRSTTLQNFAPFAIGLAAIGLVAFFIRQAAMGSIRTKLITAFVLMALLSMGLVAYSSLQTMRVTLTENIGGNLNNLAQAKAVEIGQTVKREFDLMSSLAISDAVRAAAEKANQENSLNQSEIASLDKQWMAADAADNDTQPLVSSVLNNELSAVLTRFKEKFPQHVEVFLTDRQGVNVAATNRTSDYYQGDEKWWQTASQQGMYIGQPEFDESSNTVAINMATAIYAQNSSDVVGVLRTTVNFNTLEESLLNGRFGQTGKTDIYLPNGMELELEAEEDGTSHLNLEEAALDRSIFDRTDQPYIELLHDDIPTLASQSLVKVPGSGQDAQAISALDWRIVAMQGKAEALKSVDTQTRNSIALFVAITALVGVAAVFLARLITNPIVHLKSVAEKVASGDLNIEAKVSTHDEVGTLATTFNNMTSQLKNLVGSLEQRVADRTHDLELASEVGRAVTQKVADLDDMLTTAAEMIRTRFGLYYTQVYLTDPAGRVLLLRAGTGDVGEALLKRNHRLMIDYNSLNGRAALEKKPVIVADTLENPTFKPNPLLPKTRSEMAVPLISGDRILGMLDMQSEQPGALSDASLPAFEALAGQLAIAIQNSELFAETEQARAEIESQARRLTRTGWSDYMDAIHRPEQTSYVFAENQIVTLQGAETPAANSNAFSLPLEITGEPIGTINVELENDAWTTDRKELVQSVARQVAQQIENLRLLETAERYREEAEQITRRLTHEGWEEYTETLEGGSLGFAYDLGEVVALKGDGHRDASRALTIPLSVREEAIGQLTVGKDVSTQEAREMIQAVASQLSSHIENLRLSEQNERRAAELEQAVNRLRELDRLKSSFLANMSHELRTPLNSILGFADVILEELDGPLTANMQNDLGLIQKNGQHLLHLINDVLDMAKIEAGRMNLNPEKFRVHEILDDVTSITSTLASERNLALFIEPDSDRVVEITADRTRLRQVMINLVNNAIKFTEKGSISIRASRMKDKVLISVKDTGIGIPLGKLEEVFMEFAQVDTSTTRKAGGTGLGLPISRKLIEMHGGRLWAESSGVDTEGSTFYVELPLELHLTEPVEKLVK